MATPLVSWCQKELTRLLKFDTSEDIVRYILSIESARELEDYLLELLNPEDEDHLQFIKELIQRWKPKVGNNVTVYQKEKEEEIYFAGTKPKEKKKKAKSERKEEEKENDFTSSLDGEEKSGARKKTKYVELYSAEGEAKQEIRLPGRHACECQATKHKLINNCLSCGRIVCDQEGSGPCFYCGNLVCTKQEREFMNQGTKKADQLRRKLLSDLPPNSASSLNSQLSLVSDAVTQQQHQLLPNQEAKMAEGLAKAQAHKDKLLEFDKTHTKRTKVIDDESDYYASGAGSWLTKDQKEAVQKKEEEARAKRFGSRLDRKITFDFAGRQIIDDDESAAIQMYTEDAAAQTSEITTKNKELIAMLTEEHSRYLVNPSIKMKAPEFVSGGSDSSLRRPAAPKEERTVARLQDKELMTLRDDGVCLSMHQPWASFLVKGIKKHEGRTWYSAHRGRLWIASTVKAPTAQEIISLENDYRHHYDRDIAFPSDYPTGVLLGCVDVSDVLSQEDYRGQFGGDRQDPMESGSPFVFICENPQELFVKFPIKGQHKIYKLDGHVHHAARKGARPSLAPMFEVDLQPGVSEEAEEEVREEARETAEALRMVKMQQDFGGLHLGGAGEEIQAFA